MAARKAAGAAASEVATVEVCGVEVAVDLSFLRSWQGIRLAARMQSPELDDGERLVAMVEYYERGIANIDEVSEAMGEGAQAGEVLALLSDAVREATPKN